MTQTKIRLEVIDIPNPCPAPWSAMKVVDGDAVRLCRHCNKHVYDLSSMSREAAEDFIADHFAINSAQHLCVRMYKRADDTVVTADCGRTWRDAAARWAARWSGPVGAALSLMLAAIGCGESPTTPSLILQGELAAPAATQPAPQTSLQTSPTDPTTVPTPPPATRPATTRPHLILGRVGMPKHPRPSTTQKSPT